MDPRLFGEIYAAPYGVLEPEHALVLDDGAGAAIGYVLGALDTPAFEARCEAEWWPALRARHPIGSGGNDLDELLHRDPPPRPHPPIRRGGPVSRRTSTSTSSRRRREPGGGAA